MGLNAYAAKKNHKNWSNYGNGKGVIVKLKEYECVEVKHHNDVGRTIKEWQKNGWRLHTYQTAGMGAGPMSYEVNHYLLFEKGE